MTVDILRDHVLKRPFTPFRVIASSGQAYDVRHPENAILIKGGLVVAYGGGNGDLPEHVATLSLMHLSTIETIPERKRRQRR